jgi:hypothetical protein
MTATQADAGPAYGSPEEHGLALMAELAVRLDTISERLRIQNERQNQLAQAIRVISHIPVGQITTTNGSLNQPELSGPRRGYAWEVRRVTVNTFTAGTVQCYVDANAPQNLVLPFASSGVNYPGSSNIVLENGHWLVFGATTITGNADISLGVIEIEQRWLAAYLL